MIKYKVCVYGNGAKEWYLNGEYLTEADFISRQQKPQSCEGKIVEIEGKKYKLMEV